MKEIINSSFNKDTPISIPKSQFRKLLSVSLKENGFASGILKPTSTLTNENHPGIDMELLPGYILVTHKGRQVGIPLGNVKGWVFAE